MFKGGKRPLFVVKLTIFIHWISPQNAKSALNNAKKVPDSHIQSGIKDSKAGNAQKAR